MTIESCLIEQFLPDNPEKMFEVRHPSGQMAFSANRREVLALAKSRYVSGEVNKHGYLRYLRLMVSVFAAMSIVRRFRRPPVASNLTITRPVQSGMHWKQRADNGSHARCSRGRYQWRFEWRGDREVTGAFAEREGNEPQRLGLTPSKKAARA